MWAIYRKEMRQYLMTPLAWIVWVLFIILVGVVFDFFVGRLADMYAGQEQTVSDVFVVPFFNFVRFTLLFFVPFFSMPLFAAEKGSGTLELLFTYPLTEGQLIFGKMLAALTTCAIMLAWIMLPIFWLSRYGTMDWPVVLCCILGNMLLMLDYLALGMFASSLTGSQVVAFVATFAPLMLLWLAAPLSEHFTLTNKFAAFFHECSLLDHYESFSRGIINSTDVLFYLSMAAFFIFLTAKQLESRKWRG